MFAVMSLCQESRTELQKIPCKIQRKKVQVPVYKNIQKNATREKLNHPRVKRPSGFWGLWKDQVGIKTKLPDTESGSYSISSHDSKKKPITF